MAEKNIRLSAPVKVASYAGVRVCSEYSCGGETGTVWFETGERHAEYLTADRLDAFVAVFLPRAMREGFDILCEAPVSRSLIYQIGHYLIPTLSRNIGEYSNIRLIASPADDLTQGRGAVVTGWTGGVDSMFTVMNTLDCEEKSRRLTHLLVANIGTLESGDNEKMLRMLVERAEHGAAREFGLETVWVNSNLDAVLPEPYLAVSDFRLSGAALALQKLFSVFYVSSSYEFASFSFDPNNDAYCEMFLLPMLSTRATQLISSGGAFTRIEKLSRISDYPPAGRYLHPCIYATELQNCGRCGKCVRTETGLYALGTLERFSGVFDLSDFEKHREEHIAKTLAGRKNRHCSEVCDLLRERGLVTPRAERLSRIIESAQKVADRNRDELTEKIGGAT
ncbi:MAG: hypothetical protein J6V48_07865 [Clostridia bacterium]|nr:hypothetical protein [Clostridia bacterium]